MKESRPELRHFSGISMVRLRIVTEYLNRDSRFSGQDENQATGSITAEAYLFFAVYLYSENTRLFLGRAIACP